MCILCTYQWYAPPPPLYGDRWGIGGDLTHRMCQIPHPSITIQCQIPTLYIHTRICAGTRANACAGQKPHPWGVISWRIPYQAPPLSPTGGVGRNIDRRIILTPYEYYMVLPALAINAASKPRLAASALHTALLSNSIIYISVQYTLLRCAIMTLLSLRKIPFLYFKRSIVLKLLIMLFVHLISLCFPVLFQARPIDSLNLTSYNNHCYNQASPILIVLLCKILPIYIYIYIYTCPWSVRRPIWSREGPL